MRDPGFQAFTRMAFAGVGIAALWCGHADAQVSRVIRNPMLERILAEMGRDITRTRGQWVGALEAEDLTIARILERQMGRPLATVSSGELSQATPYARSLARFQGFFSDGTPWRPATLSLETSEVPSAAQSINDEIQSALMNGPFSDEAGKSTAQFEREAAARLSVYPLFRPADGTSWRLDEASDEMIVRWPEGGGPDGISVGRFSVRQAYATAGLGMTLCVMINTCREVFSEH